MHIRVPEWGDLDIYFRATTVAEKRKIFSGKMDTIEATLDFIVRTLVFKALDADGKPMFKASEMEHIKNQSEARVLERVAAEILDRSGAVTDKAGN